jgi:hypothetical protein
MWRRSSGATVAPDEMDNRTADTLTLGAVRFRDDIFG